jgi:hypothetical protein
MPKPKRTRNPAVQWIQELVHELVVAIGNFIIVEGLEEAAAEQEAKARLRTLAPYVDHREIDNLIASLDEIWEEQDRNADAEVRARNSKAFAEFAERVKSGGDHA